MVRTSSPKIKIPKIPAKVARKYLKQATQNRKEFTDLGLDSLANDAARQERLFKQVLIKKSKQQQQLGGK